MRNLSNPSIDHGQQAASLQTRHKRNDVLRRTLATTTATEEHATLPVAPSPTLNGHVEDASQEAGNFIYKYLNGLVHHLHLNIYCEGNYYVLGGVCREIQRIHPAVYWDRTGESLVVHILAPLDDHLQLCGTAPDEGVSRIAYLGSRRIYAPTDCEEEVEDGADKSQHLPAMMRAALFAKSGKQCYLPYQDFRHLIYGDKTKNGTIIIPLVDSVSTLPDRRSLLLEQRRISKSGSLISMTHIGTAPRARIEELLEEEEEESEEVVNGPAEVQPQPVRTPNMPASVPEAPVAVSSVINDSPLHQESTKENGLVQPPAMQSSATNTAPTFVFQRPKSQQKPKAARGKRRRDWCRTIDLQAC